MKRPAILAATGAISLVAAIGTGTILGLRDSGQSADSTLPQRANPYRGSQPPSGIRLPQFALRDYRGRIVRSSRLQGKLVLTTFVDSACKEQCPIIVGIIGDALPRLAPSERRQVVALAFSVNPLVDTPAHVRRFLAERHALPNLEYLSDSVRSMRPVWKRFGVLPAVDTGDNDIHSADVRIFDRRAEWVTTQHAGVDLSPANLLHDIRVALRRGG